MNTAKDYYAILGVLPTAEDFVIEAAYRALSKRYHPDRYGGTDAHEKMGFFVDFCGRSSFLGKGQLENLLLSQDWVVTSGINVLWPRIVK